MWKALKHLLPPNHGADVEDLDLGTAFLTDNDPSGVVPNIVGGSRA